jgi:hypothetical protein
MVEIPSAGRKAAMFKNFREELQKQLGFKKDTGNGWGHPEHKQD